MVRGGGGSGGHHDLIGRLSHNPGPTARIYLHRPPQIPQKIQPDEYEEPDKTSQSGKKMNDKKEARGANNKTDNTQKVRNNKRSFRRFDGSAAAGFKLWCRKSNKK